MNNTTQDQVTATLNGSRELLYNSIIKSTYCDLYKVEDRDKQNRQLMHLYRYGLGIWLGDGTVNPEIPEDAVIRILLKLQDTVLDNLVP